MRGLHASILLAWTLTVTGVNWGAAGWIVDYEVTSDAAGGPVATGSVILPDGINADAVETRLQQVLRQHRGQAAPVAPGFKVTAP
mgnify:FL=1